MSAVKLLFSFLLLFIFTGTITALDETDILQNHQIDQIWIEFCASEIDRNRIASAILKFKRHSIPSVCIKDVVQFYIKNYAESFDNLLNFIDHMSSIHLKLVAYSTVIVALKSGRINLVNVLSFDNFFRTKLKSSTNVNNFERKMYGEYSNTIVKHIIKSIAVTDLNEILECIHNSANAAHILETIPTIVQGINLNNFTDVDRIFEFSMKLPKHHQLKMIRKVLSEMRVKSQYKHVFHVVCQVKLLSNSINGGWMTEEKQFLTEITKEIPSQTRRLLMHESIWQIKTLTVDQSLSCLASRKYNKNILLLDTLTYGWWIQISSHNSVMIRDCYNEYLSVEYTFHNESFPTMRKRDECDSTQNSWYFLMSNDLTYVQIKNIHTNELLNSENVCEIGNDGFSRRRRVALSTKCSNCDSSKWIFKLRSNRSF